MTKEEALAIRRRFKGYDWVGRVHMIELCEGNISCKDLNTKAQAFKVFFDMVDEFDILSKTSSTFDILSKYAKQCDNLATKKEKFIKEKDSYNNINNLINTQSQSEYGEDEYSKQLDVYGQSVIDYLNEKTGACFDYFRRGKRTPNADLIRIFIQKLVKRGIPTRKWKLDEKKAAHLMKHIVKVKFMKNWPAMNPKSLFGWDKCFDNFVPEAVAAGWKPELCDRESAAPYEQRTEIPR